jgi:hypothetical protein
LVSSRARAALAISAAAAIAVLAGGCRTKRQQTLRDTEGREFSARCGSGERCVLRQTAGAPAPSSQPAAVLRSPGRLLGVCTAAEGEEPQTPADCRALVCDGDDGCPPAQGMERGQCVNGLCTEPSHAVGVTDAVMLCLAGTGVGRESARQVERYAMALNCGEPCRIPTPCRQP